MSLKADFVKRKAYPAGVTSDECELLFSTLASYKDMYASLLRVFEALTNESRNDFTKAAELAVFDEEMRTRAAVNYGALSANERFLNMLKSFKEQGVSNVTSSS